MMKSDVSSVIVLLYLLVYGTNNAIWQVKELAPFDNKGWPFLKKMEQLCPSGTITTGSYSVAPMKLISVNEASNNLDSDVLEFEPVGMLMNNLEFSSNISMESAAA